MLRPRTVAGQVWLERHHELLQQFFLSLRQDGDALAEAVRSLRFLLEREPDYAREVRQLALQCALGNWNAGVPGVLDELVGVGLDAEIMSTELAAEPVPGDMLLLLLADARLLEGDRLGGLAALERLTERPDATGPAAAWVEARASLLRAELDELDRELVRADAAFRRAVEVSRPLLDDEAGALRDDWVTQVFGPPDETIAPHVASLEGWAMTLLAQTHVCALLGRLRTTGADDDRHAVAEATRAAIAEHGLTRPPSAFDMADALARLRPNVAHPLGELLRDGATGAADALLASDLATGLDPRLLEVVRAGLGAGEDEDDDVRAAWDVVIGVAVARGAERLGDVDAARTAYEASVEGAIQSRLGLPQTYALGAYATFLLRHEPGTGAGAGTGADVADMFLLAFEGTVAVEADVLDDFRSRALFDDVISLVVRDQLTRPEAFVDPDETRRLSVLLDLLRSRAAPRVAGLSHLGLGLDPDPEGSTSPLAEGLADVSNTIERIVAATSGSDGSVVLISQGPATDLRLVMIDGAGPSVHAPSDDYAGALDALDEAAAQAVFEAGAGLPDSGAVAAAGRRAYDALPSEVREALAGAEVLLVAHDFHGEVADPPFELFHDGDDHLLARTVVARFTSLDHLARTLDTRPLRPAGRRALVTAAPSALPDRPLYTAASESAAVRASLEGIGYDAPEIAEKRLSARFFTERLSYVGVLHVAAHGDSTAGVEYLVLPGGQRLSVDELLARPQRSMPFALLNTCRLGRTRYLGGGHARGLAYTLSELGAPAVLANTTDVLDDVSTALAAAFYEEAAGLPVGAALAAARRRLVASGAAPALVARVILYGDPWHAIGDAPGHEPDDPAADLLDAFFADGSDGDQVEAWLQAQVALREGTASARLRAAVALVEGIDALELPDEDSDDVDRDDDYLGEAGDDAGAMLEEAIELADRLHHPPARALLRVMRLDHAGSDVGPLRDAIRHLEPLRTTGELWRRIEVDLRGRLRRLELDTEGLTIRQLGPDPDEVDPALDAVMSILLATQQQAQQEKGKVETRPREVDLDDIAWNAVVIGHPNRFEDVGEASAFCLVLTRKLIASGDLPAAAEPYAHPVLTGLLLFLWSRQKTAHLEAELAAGQAGTVAVAVRDLAARWSPPGPGATWVAPLDAFAEQVDGALARLDAAPWETVHEETDASVAALGEAAEGLLATLAGTDAAPGAAAYVTGLLATRNRFSPLEGSVPEYIHEKLTEAVRALDDDNEERFMPYLMAGFEAVRTAEPDELLRWQMDDTASPDLATS